MKRQSGFTLIELMITMVVFVLAIAAASRIFSGLLTQFKQQSKIAETNIEGVVGLDILRKDIVHAGLGLPWNVDERSVVDTNSDGNLWDEVPGYTEATDVTYNDAPNNQPSGFKSGDNTAWNGSDRLVIKSASAASVLAAGKNTRLHPTSALPPNDVRQWGLYSDDSWNTDRVIVLSPGSTDANTRSLVVSGGSYHTQFDTLSAFKPVDRTDVRLVYGISPANASGTLRAPFNRADYFIEDPSLLPATINVPVRCATGTSVLVKATLNHDTGNLDEMPILDCVADVQVIYGVDTDATLDNAVNCYVNNLADVLAPNDAENVRNRVGDVRVYILAQEGQIDRNFTFNPPIAPSSIRVGKGSADLPGGSCTGAAVMGWDFDLSGITDWRNYRWKVYAISVKTNNLR